MTEGKRGWILTVLCVFVSLLALSCSDEPTQENSLVVPVPLTGITVHDTTITAANDSTFKQYVPMAGILDLVGRAPASGHTQGYTAYSVLQFYPSVLPARDTINVLSATLRLRLQYRLGDAAAPFAFDVYRISRSWSQNTLTWDSVQTGFYDASVSRGGFSGTVQSDSDFISVNLDTAMVRQWLSTAASTDLKYGIVLVPTPASTAVRGFVSFTGSDSTSYLPALQVIASNTSGTVRDTASYQSGQGTFVGDVGLAVDPGFIYVQSGVVYRNRLTFDISFIPRGAAINSAVLSLDMAPDFTQLTSFTTDSSISAHLSADPNPSVYESAGLALRPATGTSITFSGDISRAVQSWVKGPNYGVVLRSNLPAETSRLDLYAFYGSRAPLAGVRPRLKIIYSLGE